MGEERANGANVNPRRAIIPAQRHEGEISLTQARVDAIFQALVAERDRGLRDTDEPGSEAP